MYPISEIFSSIQGEGSFLGCPATFIRFSGCNLNCPWCDTDFSFKKYMTVDEIVSFVEYQKVIMTGGEPTLYDLEPLLVKLKELGKIVMLETNGTNPTDKIRHLIDWIVCSPKPEVNWEINERCLFDELKYVVDGQFNPKLHIKEDIKQKYKDKIWLQPESSRFYERAKQAFEMAMKEPYLRVGLQMHKIINVR